MCIRDSHSLPHGVLEMNEKLPELVETSNNVAVLFWTVEKKSVTIRLEDSIRSLNQAKLDATTAMVAEKCKDSGAAFEETLSYPPWQPELDSPLTTQASQVYTQLFGEEPTIATIHAGLECGLFAERVPGITMLSMGPKIIDAHTPDESAFVASTERFWKFLVALLAELK